MSGIVDLRGRPVADLQIKGTSLPKAQAWVEYLQEWGPQFANSEPWVKLLLNGSLVLHQSFVVFSRRLRKNRAWTGGGTMAEDTMGIVDYAESRLAWFENASEQVDQDQVPGWAKFQFASLQGALRMQVRIAKEIEQIQRKGHLIIPIDSQGRVLADSNEERPDAPGAERE